MRAGRLASVPAKIGATAAFMTLASGPALAQLSGVPGVPGISVPAAAASPADVNTVNGPVSVLGRPRPEYTPPGLQVGIFQLFPALTELGTFDSNIFAAHHGTSDVVFRTHPDMTVDDGPGPSLWTSKLNVYAEDDRYVSHSGLSNDNAGGTLALGGEFNHDLNGLSQTAFSYQHQDPGSLTTNLPFVSLRSLPAEITFSEDLGLAQDFSNAHVAAQGGYTRQDLQNIELSNGTTVAQTQLNGNFFRFGPKFAYDLGPGLRPFVQGGYNRYFYDSARFDANEYSGLVGNDFEAGPLIRGTVSVGYKVRDYDSPANPNAQGFTYGLQLTWFATQLLTVTGSGAQSFSASTVTSTTGVSSTTNIRNLAGEADYELQRNVIVSGLVSYENDDYQSTTRIDNIYAGGVGTKYLMTENLTALAQYQVTVRSSSASGFTYTRHVISAGVRLAF